jgi:serine/threonine protein kinase
MLTPRSQRNVVIDQNGRARLTEYGLAPINSDPSFTAFATCDHLGDSRWSAPEIMAPPRKGKVTAIRESKAADVFAFGMLAVEVFTGKVPLVEHENGAVVFQILGGVRPEMPENAQEVGLTAEVWKLIASCWQENQKKRPTIEEVVARWRKFVEQINNGNDAVSECVRIVSSNVAFGLVDDDLWSTQGGTTYGGADGGCWQTNNV